MCITKGQSIIISKFISCHMDAMYIASPYMISRITVYNK